MESLPKKPNEYFVKLLSVIDDMRRASFKTTPTTQQKKMLGLTFRQGSAIAQIKLLTMEEPQGVALKTLAGHLKMTVPATSLLVETMVNKGFFERNPNPEDRRAVCIRLSEKGHEICNDVQSRLLSEIDRVAEVLSQEELEMLSTNRTKPTLSTVCIHFISFPKSPKV